MKSQLLCFALLLSFMACQQSRKATSRPDTSSDGIIKNEIIVQLKGRVKPQQLTGAYQRYDLKLLRAVSEATNLWLFTYNTDKIAPEEMLNILRNSQFATNAEFNKEVEMRGRGG